MIRLDYLSAILFRMQETKENPLSGGMFSEDVLNLLIDKTTI